MSSAVMAQEARSGSESRFGYLFFSLWLRIGDPATQCGEWQTEPISSAHPSFTPIFLSSLSLPLHGDSANQAWGVMDVLAVTDFPDARLKSAIHSADAGSILIIPREGGYLTRFYIELEKLKDGERVVSACNTNELGMLERATSTLMKFLCIARHRIHRAPKISQLSI